MIYLGEDFTHQCQYPIGQNSLHKVLTPSHSWPEQTRGPSGTHASMSVGKSWGRRERQAQVRCPWAQLTLRCKTLHSSSCRQWVSETVHKRCLIQYVPALTVQMQSRGKNVSLAKHTRMTQKTRLTVKRTGVNYVMCLPKKIKQDKKKNKKTLPCWAALIRAECLEIGGSWYYSTLYCFFST